MKFSTTWLDEWVNTGLSKEALAELITMAGLEVDGIEPVAGDFNQVVVGEVVACSQHPDADKLQVTKVNVGNDELLDIVCGAPNCRTGLKVAVAVVGAVLPGDFKIKKAKLRGQASNGMLCSYGELGIELDSSGIIELPLDAPIGACVRDYLQLNDSIVEIDLTPNRADCLSMAGVAREVGVLKQATVNWPEIAEVPATIADTVAVNICDSGEGSPPTEPAENCTFCPRTAASTCEADMPKARSFSGFNQICIEYSPPNTCVLPTPGTREI